MFIAALQEPRCVGKFPIELLTLMLQPVHSLCRPQQYWVKELEVSRISPSNLPLLRGDANLQRNLWQMIYSHHMVTHQVEASF